MGCACISKLGQCQYARQSERDHRSRNLNSLLFCSSATVLDPRVGQTTAAAPASEAEAVVRSPINMAAAKIAAVDFIDILNILLTSYVQSEQQKRLKPSTG